MSLMYFLYDHWYNEVALISCNSFLLTLSSTFIRALLLYKAVEKAITSYTKAFLDMRSKSASVIDITKTYYVANFIRLRQIRLTY